MLCLRDACLSCAVCCVTQGPFLDDVRRQADASAPNTVRGSSGAHVTLPGYYGSASTGLIIPKVTVRLWLCWDLLWVGACFVVSSDMLALACLGVCRCILLLMRSCNSRHWQPAAGAGAGGAVPVTMRPPSCVVLASGAAHFMSI